MKVQDVIEQLSQLYNKDDVILVHMWQPEDIIIQAKDRDIAISQKEAEDILGLIEHSIDCSIGVNWDVVDCFTDSYKEDN